MKITINTNECKFSINKIVYDIPIIMKAGYMFIDEYYIFFELLSESEIQVTISPKDKNKDLNIVAKEFCNELLIQSIRYDTYKNTKNIREIILGRALYSACIEEDDFDEKDFSFEENISDTDDLNKIAKNWFEELPNE